MKKYILYTNTKHLYHAHELIFDDFESLYAHLIKEFYFEEWDYNSIIEDYKTYIEDSISDWVYEYSIKDFLFDTFNILNGMDIEIFEKIFNGELVLLSTYSDIRYSIIIDSCDLKNQTEYLIIAINALLKKHGTTTSPVGVVPEHEIVVDSDFIDGQVAFDEDIPF